LHGEYYTSERVLRARELVLENLLAIRIRKLVHDEWKEGIMAPLEYLPVRSILL
jgi:hypothetical protein